MSEDLGSLLREVRSSNADEIPEPDFRSRKWRAQPSTAPLPEGASPRSPVPAARSQASTDERSPTKVPSAFEKVEGENPEPASPVLPIPVSPAFTPIHPPRAFATVALFGLLGLALAVRYLVTPAGPTLPAEDPFMHVVFAREYLSTGLFAPAEWNGWQTLYPPGLAAIHGMFSAATGVDPYSIAKWGALPLAALGVAAVFLTARALAGTPAGIAAGAFAATTPELVFRGSFFTPTVLLLALVPIVLLASAATARGGKGWPLVLLVTGTAVAIAHPWASLIILGACGIFVVLRLVILQGSPRAVADATRVAVPILGVAGISASILATQGLGSGTARGTVFIPAAFAGVVIILFLAGWLAAPARRWYAPRGAARYEILILAAGACALAAVIVARRLLPVDLASEAGGIRLAALVAVAGASALVLALLALVTARAGMPAIPQSWFRGIATVLVSAVAVYFIGIEVQARFLADPLPYVSYRWMLGQGLLAAAACGLALFFSRRSDLAIIGFALGAVTVPLTLHAFVDAWFLPHRMMVFVALACCFLGGFAVAGAYSTVAGWLTKAKAGASKDTIRRAASKAAVAWLIVALVAGPAIAIPAAEERYAWYTLFDEDEFTILAELADQDVSGSIVTMSWQSSLVMKSLAPEPWRIWPSLELFTNWTYRQESKAWADPIAYIIVDDHGIKSLAALGPLDSFTYFLDEDRYELVESAGDLLVYRVHAE